MLKISVGIKPNKDTGKPERRKRAGKPPHKKEEEASWKAIMSKKQVRFGR